MKRGLLVVGLVVVLTGCVDKSPAYRIGVSQCSDDEWRAQMNKEIRREALFYDNLEIEIRSVKDDNQAQINDIGYFIDEGFDLIMVSPNEAAPLTPVIEEAFDRGIPVILIDRNILSDKYTAHVWADNYDIGKSVGEYISTQLKGKGKIVELTGLSGSTPARDRHQGLMSVISKFPGIELLAMNDAGWLHEEGYEVMKNMLEEYPDMDLVFAQNDRMASGAYEAARQAGRENDISFIGIDATTGEGYGVDHVLKGILDATFIYPTGGDIAMQLAMKILRQEPFNKENLLYTAVVDQTNARVMSLQTSQLDELDRKIGLLNSSLNLHVARLANQRIFIYAALTILGLVLIILFLISKAYRTKHLLNSRLSAQNREITSQKEQLKTQRDQLMELSQKLEEATEKDFIDILSKIVEKNISNSSFSVDDMGKEMGMSRVQLYRKIKILTQYSPNEFLRIARLKKASSLLSSSGKTIAEITYEVGFTSPSYFTKCFKEYFGESPTDYLKKVTTKK